MGEGGRESGAQRAPSSHHPTPPLSSPLGKARTGRGQALLRSAISSDGSATRGSFKGLAGDTQGVYPVTNPLPQW